MSKNQKSPQNEKKQPLEPSVNEASTDSELSDEQLESVAGGASDIFAKIGNIKGESLDSKHKDEIEISSFSWGATQPAINPLLKK